MKKIIFVICMFFSFMLVVNATEDLTENSTSAILMDYSTGKILYEKNSDEQLAPASMTKIASLLIVMEYIENGKLSMDDDVFISENAAGMGGSQVYLEAGETYKVSELIKSAAIASANDAIVALAEKVAGSEENFVVLMNDKCEELGCTNTNFMNPHGLDEENHYSSAHDMAILARELVSYEDILTYTSVYEDYLTRNDGSKTWLVNTNKLIRYYIGVDGLKTGYTSDAGYCLTATALKNDLRLITVVMGSDSSENRSADTISMLDYGYSNYSVFVIKDSEESIGSVDVVGGKVSSVDLYLNEDAVDLKSISDENKTYEVIYEIENVVAPLSANDVVGIAQIIDNEGNIIDEVDVIIKEDIEKANFWDYLKYNFKIVISGK